MYLQRLSGNVFGSILNMIAIDPYRRQFYFRCWTIKKNLEFLELNNKIVSEKIHSIAKWNRGSKHDRKQIQHDRDRSLPTPVSFSMLCYQKNTSSFVSRIT